MTSACRSRMVLLGRMDLLARRTMGPSGLSQIGVARRLRVSVGVLLVTGLLLLGAGVASASSWSIQRAANPAGPAGSELFGVSCAARNACTAVGDSNPSGDSRALVERWNGARWSVQPTPSPPGSTLVSVSCASRKACTAFGDASPPLGSTSTGTRALMEQWNGARWSIERLPSGFASLGGVSSAGEGAVDCSSRSACIAVSGLGSSARWNGTRWSIQRIPRGVGYLEDVSCASETGCEAVGGAGAARWDGRSWHDQPIPTDRSSGPDLSAVSCSSVTACVAIGNAENYSAMPIGDRWNGSTWSLLHPVNPPFLIISEQFSGVSCASATACFAVGSEAIGDNTQALEHGALLAELWNGTRWSTVLSRNPAKALHESSCPFGSCATLNGVSCITATSCIAVGSFDVLDPKISMSSYPIPIVARY